MRVWRLTRRPFADLSGEGARRYGGRWTSPGKAVVYTAESPSLALLEVLVHLDLTPDLLPAHYVMMEIEVPDDAWRLDIASLPADHPDPRAAGDAWLAGGVESVLAVSSVVVPRQTNYLLSPLHPDAARFRIVMVAEFVIDRRLL
jgi:RES domain-containing protein